MIVSRFESMCIRVFLGGIVEAVGQGRLRIDDPNVRAVAEWLGRKGTTHDGQAEIDAGENVSKL